MKNFIDAYDVLLLHCDGANNGTSFPDSSFSNPKTITANNNAVTSTTQIQFGSASLKVTNGTTDCLSLPDTVDMHFGSGAWTVEMWIYQTSQGTNDSVLFDNRGTATGSSIVLFVSGSGDGAFRLDSFIDGVLRVNSGANAIGLNAWTHIAYVRSGDVLTIYINGTSVGTYSFSAGYSITNPSGGTITTKIGTRNDTTNGFIGFIDEVRVSKGVARWTSNFTVPNAAYRRNEFTLSDI